MIKSLVYVLCPPSVFYLSRRSRMKIIPSYPLAALQFLLLVLLLGFPLPSSASEMRLDEQSLRCINCHENSIQGGLVCHKGGCDHLIGEDYAEQAARNRTLTPPSSLNPALKLINGRVGCLTCHIPFDKKSHLDIAAKRFEIYKATGTDPMLAVDNNGSGLCMACHRK